jgi:penicillin amidase
MTIDRPEPLLFNAWVREFYRATLTRAGVPIEHGGPVPDFVAHVMRVTGPAGTADRDATLADALRAADAFLTARFGADPAGWRWGAAHMALFQHPVLRNLPILGRLTTISIESPGDETTINRGGVDLNLRHVHGAGFRGVYDLGDLERSLFIAAPGQSGNPLSRDARRFVRRWRDGGMITISDRPDQIRASIRMTP